MTTPKKDIFGILENLTDEEFDKFKWLLSDVGTMHGVAAIPQGKLDGVSRMKTADLMAQTYYKNAIEVAKKVLKDIPRNDLVHTSCETISGAPATIHRPVPESNSPATAFISAYESALNWINGEFPYEEEPKTLTGTYIKFLFKAAILWKVKLHGGSQTDPLSKMVSPLAKLAFKQTQNRNLVFYESDLTECGIDIRTATAWYPRLLTQVSKEESGLYEDKVFRFDHPSLQEFLAALHVYQQFNNSEVNVLADKLRSSHESAETHFYQIAVDRALASPNGHMDLFLHFLLGLSLPANRKLLGGLLTQTGNGSDAGRKKTAEYIKTKISGNIGSRRNISLIGWLKELNFSMW